MKKALLIITSLMLFITTGCSAMIVEDSVNEVTVEEVVNRIEEEDTFAFILGSDNCPACVQYKENLKDLKKKEDIVLDYIDLDNSEENSMEDTADLIVQHLDGDLEDGLSTPTTYFIVDGKVKGEPVVGSVPAEEVLSLYRNMTEKEITREDLDQQKEEKTDKQKAAEKEAIKQKKIDERDSNYESEGNGAK